MIIFFSRTLISCDTAGSLSNQICEHKLIYLCTKIETVNIRNEKNERCSDGRVKQLVQEIANKLYV